MLTEGVNSPAAQRVEPKSAEYFTHCPRPDEVDVGILVFCEAGPGNGTRKKEMGKGGIRPRGPDEPPMPAGMVPRLSAAPGQACARL